MIVVHNAIINTLRWMSAKKLKLKLKDYDWKEKQSRVDVPRRWGCFSVGQNKTSGKELLWSGHSQGKTYSVTVLLMWSAKAMLWSG